MASLKLPADAPSPRLCNVKKHYDTQEYGFNLHAEKGKGQFIGAVDSGSIAEEAGLRPGDRIFAVNGFNIQGVSHKEVVSKIKSNPLQCELLVISEEGAKWYELHDIAIDASLPNIIRPCEELDDFGNYPGVSVAHQQSSISETKAQLKLSNNHRSPPNSNTPRAFVSPEKKRTEPKIQVSSMDRSTNPRPRLCILEKRIPEDEFGFNLHVEKPKGHFIGAVDKGGIADKAGLEMGQRIVGVNGELIYPHTPHKDVVGLIKKDPLTTELLVASEEVDRWYSDNAVPYSFETVIVYSRPRGLSKESVNQSLPNGSLPHSRKETMDSQPEQHLKTITTNVHEEVVHIEPPTNDHQEIHFDDHAYSYVSHDHETTAPPPPNDDLLDQVFSNIPLATLNYVHDTPQHPLEIEKPHRDIEVHHEPHLEELHIHEDVVHEAKEAEEEIHHVNGHHTPESSRASTPKPAPTLYIPPPPPAPPATTHRTASPTVSESSRSNGSSEVQNKPPSHDQARDIFKLNAKEARQLLTQKKKDPRRQNMSLEQKHDIILNL